VTFTDEVPDLNFYKGSSGGRILPLWSDSNSADSNLKLSFLIHLSEVFGESASPEDLMAYIAAIAAHPAYTARFQEHFSTPGLRIPITADSSLFRQAVVLGKRVLWLHTFGERMIDPAANRPAQPPRLPADRRPIVPKEGAISEDPDEMPDTLNYDAGKQRLLVGHGFIGHVTQAMFEYEVSGKQILTQWFSYRKKNRERPIIGDRRPPSKLGDIQPDYWLPEYTTELLNVLNVLGLLVDLEPEQAALLDSICAGPLISQDELQESGAFDVTAAKSLKKSTAKVEHPQLF
jgi:hypothetical protein